MRWQNETSDEMAKCESKTRQAFICTSNLLQSFNSSHQERQNEVEGAAAEKKEERKEERFDWTLKYSRRRGGI